MYSAEDRALFFEAHARLGSIIGAADELGFTRPTCTMWAPDGDRVPGSAYSAEDKTEFFEALDRTDNVTAAAKSMGINVQTAYTWA